MKSLVGIVVLKIKFFHQRFHKLQFNSYAKAKKRANSTKGLIVAILLKNIPQNVYRFSQVYPVSFIK
jgi:hypothetical protein